jgi:hypothetical protein
MALEGAGYRCTMPGEDDGLTPDAAPTGGHDHHSRIADKQRFAGKPEGDDDVTGDAGGGGTLAPDLDERLDEDPEDVSINRRDVPPTPENSIEARTED